MLNGSGLAYASEAAASVTGLTVESGDARYVNITGDETVLGVKTFTGALMAQAGATSSGNILISKGNPRLQFRDTSAGGHSQGFDVHVSSDRFYIDDNTHNLIFLDYGVVNNLDTLSLKSNQFAVYSSASGATPQLALLVDSGRNTRVSGNLYVSGVLIDSAGNSTLDPKNYYLQSNGSTSLDWAERSASSSSGLVSLSWEDMVLYDSSEATSLAWSDRQLSGNWSTNTVPNWSGSVVNKGYIDSITGSLGGGAIPSDVVRTIGNQTIMGNKTFHGETTFNNNVGVYGKLIATDILDVSSIDTDARKLYQDLGYESLNWNDGTTKDFYGAVSIDWLNADLKSRIADFSGSVLNWQSLEMYDNSAFQSVEWGARRLDGTGGFSDVAVDWASRVLSGDWSTNTSPTQSGHITNKSYVDSNNVYCLNFGHTTLTTPLDSTSYYFGGLHNENANTSSSDASVVYAVNSGVLRSVVGNSFVVGTLASSETVSLIVSVNGTDVATGIYNMTGKNNIIQSGLQSINRSISKYDAIQMRFVTPAWATNPTSVRHNVNAYFTVG